MSLTMSICIAALVGASAMANELEYVITGVDEPLRANVLAHIENARFGRRVQLEPRDYDEAIADTAKRAHAALRPFGYYRPEIQGQVEREGNGGIRLTLDINPGPPMIVTSVLVRVVGDGATETVFREWQEGWPLGTGSTLNQQEWETQKVRAIEGAKAHGYLGAGFSEHALEIDLVANTATLKLVLDTGPQYVFGSIDFGEHVLKPGILELLPRFNRGEPYDSRLLETFRVDLWKTGYFTSVDVQEIARPGGSPPEVDLKVTLATERRNSYQGSLGVGSDTGIRLQTQWSRHPVSRNGDRIDTGIGWQDEDEEFSVHAKYHRPRLTQQRQLWVVEFFAKLENTDLEIKRESEDEHYIKIGNGDVVDLHLRTGRMKVRNLKRGNRQSFETMFVQYLNSKQEFDLLYPTPSLEGDISYLTENSDDNISVGFEADLVDVRGNGFNTEGRRDRAWVFHSDKALGSDREFTQAYIGTRRVFRKSERWKILVRGEVGYTDASVKELNIDVDTATVDISLSELPGYYRFKAGGSHSVRGYAFESLSNNDIGSNHIITASVEAEMRIANNWSAAAFVDIGNAFNDWRHPDLHKGAGLGIRWYSIAGPISLDVAQALDFSGNPWRVHFTIGTPLL